MADPLNEFRSQFFRYTNQRVCFRDDRGKLLWANGSFLCDFGITSLDEAIGSKIESLADNECALKNRLMEMESDVYKRKLSSPKSQLRTAIHQKKVVVSGECHPVLNRRKQFIGISTSYNVEQVAHDSSYEKMMIESLINSSEDCIYFKDLNSRFIRCSDSMVNRLGAKSMDELVGKSDFDFWEPQCAQSFFDEEMEIIRTGRSISGVCQEEVRKDGQSSWVISSKMPLVDSNENIIGTFGISKDITELKNTEAKLENTHEQLLEASRLTGMAEIATNVIHNVGNVLNSINISISLGADLVRNQDASNLLRAANMLEENASSPDYLKSDSRGKVLPGFIRLSAQTLANSRARLIAEFENLRKHLEHVKNIVSMQQEFASAKQVLEPQDISSLVDDAIQMSEGTLGTSNFSINVSSPKRIHAIIEKHKVLQILINLIRNARHACEANPSPSEHRISISINTVGSDFFTIEVADSGIGILPEHLTCIFNHGFTTKETGKGFGLHASANTAREMGGSLIATSAGMGCGAAFVLTLPVRPKIRTPEITRNIGKVADTTTAARIPQIGSGLGAAEATGHTAVRNVQQL